MIRTQMELSVPVIAAIRPASGADLGPLTDFFAGLSPQSRYLRFFAPVSPRPGLVRRMCGGDGRTYAVVAVRGGVIIGHAMAVDEVGPRGVRSADFGVVVADAWQGRGVGLALMRALVTGARARGVTSVTMDVLPENRRMLALIAGHWPAARIEDSAGFASFRIRLRQQPQEPDAQRASLASVG